MTTRKLGLRMALASLTLAAASATMAGSAWASPPADGSVGNADGKAPKGQTAGDKNNGYECDANHGVGNGNPAHTADCGGGGGGEL
jgi:hypothetical protein